MSRKRKKKSSKAIDSKETQERPVPNRPSRLFLREGYSITCRLDGLEIRTVEYHAGVLKLPWTELERLMIESGFVPPRESGQAEEHDRPRVN